LSGLGNRRFDVVVLNYERLHLFLDNFGRLGSFDPGRDRLTVVTCSPSSAERDLVAAFESSHGVPVRYLTRANRGIDQLARAEYFTGQVGTSEENLSYRFIFQMQDHYLEMDDPASRWGAEWDFRVKGDVLPDDVVLDFDVMEELAASHGLAGMFCDRNDPCYMQIDGQRFVAPNGGNFVIASSEVARPEVQVACRRLAATCDNTYRWAVHAEYTWGRIFFQEGKPFYDLKRDRLFTRWSREEFYVSPDDYEALQRYYEGPAVRRAAMQAGTRARAVLRAARARLSPL
jgi:hypothetical protein